MEILIQLTGFFGILASIISFQCKKHKSILFFRTLNEFIFAIQYFMLGAFTGMTMNLIGCARNLIFTHQISKNKSAKLWITIFSFLFVVLGLAVWQGPKSVLIIVAKVLSTLAYGNKNTSFVRKIIFVTSTSWLIYNVLVFSIAGALCEAFTLVSIIIGIVRFDLLPHVKKKKI